MSTFLARPLAVTALLLLAVGCGDDSEGSDPADARPAADAASPDAMPIADAMPDAGPEPDAPPSTFGVIAGDCDVLDTELSSPEPAVIDSAIDFARMYTDADLDRLTPGGQEIIADGNAGGSSLFSEVFSYEVLARCEMATLLKTETEIVYDTPDTAITDILVSIDDTKIGVSVTRAVAFPFEDPYTVAQAKTLLEGKLADILESSENVSAEDAWQKQILAVMAYTPGHADSLHEALTQIDPAIKADTIVWIIVSNGADDFIYCDGPCE